MLDALFAEMSAGGVDLDEVNAAWAQARRELNNDAAGYAETVRRRAARWGLVREFDASLQEIPRCP